MNPVADESGLNVDELRAQTRSCGNVTHLNNAGSALPPAVVVDTVIEHLRAEEAMGGYEAHAAAQERIDAVYTSVATLIDSRPDQIALVESATAAWGRAFAAIEHTRPLGPGDRILVSSSEYASNVLPILQLTRHCGVTLEFVPDGPDGCLDVSALTAMLDTDVAVVAVNHCPSQNGLINDVPAVSAALRAAGSTAWYIVDACQSVGQLPVSAAEIGADFLSATGRKFLRGPRGTGFLYCSDRALNELEPFPLDLHSATWQATGFTVAEGATRFESWEKSYASILGLGAAIDYSLDCGIPALALRINFLATTLRQLLRELPGVTVTDRGLAQSGIVTFTHESLAAADLVASIRAAGINVSLSTADYSRIDFDGHGLSGVVRVSPHAYNTEVELMQLIAHLSGLINPLQ